MLVSLLMAELGVHSVAYAFPRVKIITTAVDKGLDHLLHVVPGIGQSSSHPLPSWTTEGSPSRRPRRFDESSFKKKKIPASQNTVIVSLYPNALFHW